MKTRHLFLLILSSLLGVTACTPGKNVSRSPKSRHFFDAFVGENNYGQTFDKWTQTQRTQSDFDLTLLADVTFWTTKLREAYVDEAAEQYRLPEDEAKALAYTEQIENEKYFVFIISATTRELKWNDLDSSKSIWRVTLEDKSQNMRVRAEHVQKLSYRDERSRYFYQRMNRFNETYKFLFPKYKMQKAKMLSLYIAGPRGQLVFKFDNPERVAQAESTSP